jgi:hypothetical protein
LTWIRTSERRKDDADPDATVMLPARGVKEHSFDEDATVVPAAREDDDATVMIPAAKSDDDATVMTCAGGRCGRNGHDFRREGARANPRVDHRDSYA